MDVLDAARAAAAAGVRAIRTCAKRSRAREATDGPSRRVGHASPDDEYLETPPGSTYEHTDANVWIVVKFLFWLVVSAVVIHVGLAGVYTLLIEQAMETGERRVPAGGGARRAAAADAAAAAVPARTSSTSSARAKSALLDRYGWVNKDGGHRAHPDRGGDAADRRARAAGAQPARRRSRRNAGHDAGRLELGARRWSGGDNERQARTRLSRLHGRVWRWALRLWALCLYRGAARASRVSRQATAIPGDPGERGDGRRCRSSRRSRSSSGSTSRCRSTRVQGRDGRAVTLGDFFEPASPWCWRSSTTSARCCARR